MLVRESISFERGRNPKEALGFKTVVLPNVPKPKTDPKAETYGELCYIKYGKWAGLIGDIFSSSNPEKNERNIICPGTQGAYKWDKIGDYDISGIVNDNEVELFLGTNEDAIEYNMQVINDEKWLEDFNYRISLRQENFHDEYNYHPSYFMEKPAIIQTPYSGSKKNKKI